jgi:hypothetical protein
LHAQSRSFHSGFDRKTALDGQSHFRQVLRHGETWTTRSSDDLIPGTKPDGVKGGQFGNFVIAVTNSLEENAQLHFAHTFLKLGNGKRKQI